MRTMWRVQEVRAIEGQTTAILEQVEWYRRNPDHAAAMADESHEGDMPDEFIDAEPGEAGAEYIEAVNGTKSLVLDITDGLDLRPGDNVLLTIDAMDRISA